MQPIRPSAIRHSAVILAIVLAFVLSACATRLLQPVANQLPTPTASMFVSVAAAITNTQAIGSNGATTDAIDPAATRAITTPFVTNGNVINGDVINATPQDTTPLTTAIASDAASTVMSLTSSAEAATTLTQGNGAQGNGYDNPISPVDVVASYFDAVELADYARAYDYWESAPLTYDDFAAGYAETVSVQVIVEPPTRLEGAAGSLYAMVPTYLVAQHTDGSVHSFAGCITTRKSNVPAPDEADPAWYIYEAQFAKVDNFTNISTALAAACAP
jgi:hypothetical protein